MSTQFPPSSPLRDEKEIGSNPFEYAKKPLEEKESRGRFRGRTLDYPTPHPSSSIGRSSSPHYQSDNEYEEPKKVSFEINKPVMDHSSYPVRVTKIPLSLPEFTVGRSSRISDVAIKTKNRNISRKHLKVSHTRQQIRIECLGANGYGMTIPKACDVTQLSENEFNLVPIRSPLSEENLKKLNASRTIKLNANSTEFLVRCGQVITLPLINNLILEIKDSVILLNPKVESDETDDELPMKTNVQEANESQQTPIKPVMIHPHTPNKTLFKITSEESTPIKRFKKASSTAPSGPLQDKTNTYQNSKKFKRAKSEEPKLKPVKAADEEPEPRLEDIEDLEEIDNILINHLAFSRLSSTPKSILRKISDKIDDLTDKQMMLILNAIPSVGVIYRDGKDAAGKPLDEEYYYIPEQDDDENRKQLVGSIKGHGGIRACRRTHKQYYWKKPAPIKNKGPKNSTN